MHTVHLLLCVGSVQSVCAGMEKLTKFFSKELSHGVLAMCRSGLMCSQVNAA